MSDVNLFALTVQRVNWLAKRQALITENVANVNTPGFQARDIMAFDKVLQKQSVGLVATQPGHIAVDGASLSLAARARRVDDNGEAVLSGNSVNLEQELSRGGDVARAYTMASTLTKTFHRMLIATAKSSS